MSGGISVTGGIANSSLSSALVSVILEALCCNAFEEENQAGQAKWSLQDAI